MEPLKVAQELWDRVQARDWVGLGELLSDDLVVDWPVSGERIVGRENYVAVNAEYPEGWAINVLRIVADGEVVVSEVEVPHETMGEIFRVASFWTVRGGKVVDVGSIGRVWVRTPRRSGGLHMCSGCDHVPLTSRAVAGACLPPAGFGGASRHPLQVKGTGQRKSQPGPSTLLRPQAPGAPSTGR